MEEEGGVNGKWNEGIQDKALYSGQIHRVKYQMLQRYE